MIPTSFAALFWAGVEVGRVNCTDKGREHLCIPARRWFVARWRCIRCNRWFRWDAR